MEPPIHSLRSLFTQLGLDNTDEGIDKFILKHSPIPQSLELHEANFWSPSQAQFLQESIEEDADWAEIIDHLDAMLR